MKVKLLYLFTLGLCLTTFLTHAATITVTTSADAGAGSLRDAAAVAVAGDDIVFAAATDGTPIVLTSGAITIPVMVTITGNGIGTTVIDGNGASGILSIQSAGQVDVASLTLTNGAAAVNGGAIETVSTTLNVDMVDFLQVYKKHDCPAFCSLGFHNLLILD